MIGSVGHMALLSLRYFFSYRVVLRSKAILDEIPCWPIIHSNGFHTVVLTEALRIGKENPFQEYIQIPNYVDFCLFQDGKASLYSICQQVSSCHFEG